MRESMRKLFEIFGYNRTERPTEDDIARNNLGPAGVPGQPDRHRMDQDKLEQTPKPLDPGHTA